MQVAIPLLAPHISALGSTAPPGQRPHVAGCGACLVPRGEPGPWASLALATCTAARRGSTPGPPASGSCPLPGPGSPRLRKSAPRTPASAQWKQAMERSLAGSLDWAYTDVRCCRRLAPAVLALKASSARSAASHVRLATPVEGFRQNALHQNALSLSVCTTGLVGACGLFACLIAVAVVCLFALLLVAPVSSCWLLDWLLAVAVSLLFACLFGCFIDCLPDRLIA